MLSFDMFLHSFETMIINTLVARNASTSKQLLMKSLFQCSA